MSNLRHLQSDGNRLLKSVKYVQNPIYLWELLLWAKNNKPATVSSIYCNKLNEVDFNASCCSNGFSFHGKHGPALEASMMFGALRASATHLYQAKITTYQNRPEPFRTHRIWKVSRIFKNIHQLSQTKVTSPLASSPNISIPFSQA